MFQKRAFIVASTCFLLTACATSAPVDKTSTAVSTQKAAVAPVADENTAILSIARFGTTGYALKARILVDGEEVGRLKNKQYLSVPIEPGTREIKLKFNPLSLQKGHSFKLDAKAGESYAFRITSSTSGSVGGAYGNNLSTTFRIVPSNMITVNSCCELISSP